MLTLTDIYVYPIKSLAGIRVPEAWVEPRGLENDRRWLLIDEKGKFLSQRTFPELALLEVQFEGPGLVVSHRHRPEMEPLHIPFLHPTSALIPVQIWNDTCLANTVSDEADHWFSEVLHQPVRLVKMPESTHRPVDPEYAHNGEIVSFADAYPFLIIGNSSLDYLNSLLPEPVPMNRFRPNFVFSGGEPHAEDNWTNFQIGEVAFKAVKPCARCVVTTINQRTAETGKEPLRTLATYRSVKGKVLFGQNVLERTSGLVKTGDLIILY